MRGWIFVFHGCETRFCWLFEEPSSFVLSLLTTHSRNDWIALYALFKMLAAVKFTLLAICLSLRYRPSISSDYILRVRLRYQLILCILLNPVNE